MRSPCKYVGVVPWTVFDALMTVLKITENERLFCRLLSSDPTMAALMRTTTAVTVVSGGVKVCMKIPLLKYL